MCSRATTRPPATATTLVGRNDPPRHGSLQITYNGRPLYVNEHEGPGEIKCHNVDLHGGLWWVVTSHHSPAA